jgi:hypothetical protein
MIIKLETELEDIAAQELADLILTAREKYNRNLVRRIRRLWDNESWNSILKKIDTEGSTWYVWWMDGVRKFIRTNKLKIVER